MDPNDEVLNALLYLEKLTALVCNPNTPAQVAEIARDSAVMIIRKLDSWFN